MKKFMFAAGVFLFAIAFVLTIMALLFPDNGLFQALWARGIFTFRGEGSLLVILLTSGLFAAFGLGLLIAGAGSRGDV